RGGRGFGRRFAFAGRVPLVGGTTIAGLLAVAGRAALAGLLPVAGLLAVTGRVAVAGLLAVPGPLLVARLLAVTGRVPVAGLLAVTGRVPVAGLLAVTGLLLVAGLLAVTGRVPVAGLVAPTGRVLVAGILAVTGPLAPVGLRGHEHRDRVRGDRHGAALGVPGGALDDLVGTVGLHFVEPVVDPGHAVDRLGDRCVGGVEHRHHAVQSGVHVLADGVVDAHHQQPGRGVGARIGEGDLLRDQVRVAEGEQR